MMRIALAFVILLAGSVACSGGKKGSTTTGSGSGSGSETPVLAKKASVSWGIQKGQNSDAEIFLAVTDETGHQVSHPVGTFKGTCEVATPLPEMKALIGLACKDGASTTELHAVVQGIEVIILKLVVMNGATPDPMERVEVTRVKVSSGAAIVAG